MRQVSILSIPPTSDVPAFLEWVKQTLQDMTDASAENIFEPETLDAYAKIASPTFTGTPAAPTPSPGDNDTSIATTGFVTDAVGTAVAQEVTDRDAAIATAVGAIDLSGYVEQTRTITAGVGLSGGGDLSANRTIDLEDTPVLPGSYDLATVTVDQQGRITGIAAGVPEPWTTEFKTSNQTLASSTAWTDVAELSLPVTAGTYVLEGVVIGNSGGGGAEFAINGPTLGDMRVGFQAAVAVAYDSAMFAVAASFNFAFGFAGVVSVADSGTLTLRFKQTTSNASGVTVVAGSSLKWSRLA